MTAVCHRSQYKQKLSMHLGFEYEKADPSIVHILHPKTSKAIQNARWCYETIKRDKGNNPSTWESSTNVFELVEELRKWQS